MTNSSTKTETPETTNDYDLLWDDEPAHLARKVRGAMSEGWELHGPTLIAGRLVMQAIIKWGKPKKERLYG